MTATRQDIERWLARGKELNATHVIVACDTYDYDNYPVYITAGKDVHTEEARIKSASMQRVDEVYCLSMDLEEQLSRCRCFEYGP